MLEKCLYSFQLAFSLGFRKVALWPRSLWFSCLSVCPTYMSVACLGH